MKKWISFIICIGMICCFAACKDKKVEDSFYDFQTDYFQYTIGDSIFSYDISSDGKLYCFYIDLSERIKKTENSEKEDYVEEDTIEIIGQVYTSLAALNEFGEVVEEYQIPGSASNVKLNEDDTAVYYLLSEEAKICKYILDTAEVEEVCKIPENILVTSYYVLADQVILFGSDCSNGSLFFTVEDHMVGVLDKCTGIFEIIPISNPLCVSLTMDDNLMIYAVENDYDNYFIEYYTEEKSLGEKIYQNLQSIQEFAICNEQNSFVYTKNKERATEMVLVYSELGENASEVEMLPNCQRGNGLVYRYGNTYTLSEDQKSILRIKNSAYSNTNAELVLLSPLYYNGYNPFGCGYLTKNMYKTEDELALSMLAQDKDYDLFMVNSALDVGENIRDKGAFYPLNEIDGVEEYLDACYPYIKEAAIDPNGDIWMLPFRVNVPMLLYNAEKVEQYGYDLSKGLSIENFCDMINSISLQESLEGRYYIDEYEYTNALIYEYLSTHDSFDTERFRDLMFHMKTIVNYPLESERLAYTNYIRNDTSLQVFIYFCNLLDYQGRKGCEDFHLTAAPSMTGDGGNMATCHFLCINPSSKNLKTAIRYISDLCHYMLTQEDISMRTSEAYEEMSIEEQEIYNIYSNGNIWFGYPDEILREDLDKYMNDELDLETVIQEADRKLQTFLEE